MENEYQNYTTNTGVYYTTDGSTPLGAFGVGAGTTQFIAGGYSCTFNYLGNNIDVAKATIPKVAAGKTVKYIISAWNSGGGDEIFANGCGNCGSENSNASLATVFSYTVTNSAAVEVSSTGGTTAGSYATLKAAFDAINAGTHTGTITINIYANTSEAAACVLNSSGAVSASYTSVSVRPAVDGVIISGAGSGTGRGLIELNGADNVTIDGDNPNTAGTNRNLTIKSISNTALCFCNKNCISSNYSYQC